MDLEILKQKNSLYYQPMKNHNLSYPSKFNFFKHLLMLSSLCFSISDTVSHIMLVSQDQNRRATRKNASKCLNLFHYVK